MLPEVEPVYPEAASGFLESAHHVAWPLAFAPLAAWLRVIAHVHPEAASGSLQAAPGMPEVYLEPAGFPGQFEAKVEVPEVVQPAAALEGSQERA